MDDICLIPSQVIIDHIQGLENRVLWVSSDKTIGYWICLSSKKNVPARFNYEKIADGISKGSYSFSLDLHMAHARGTLTAAASEHRDKAWKLIGNAVKQEPDIYDRSLRGKILKEIEATTGVKFNNLYGYLGKYWKGGMIPDALLPCFDNCGKSSPLDNPDAKRRGRKKVEGAEGKVLTVQDTQYFSAALKKYYYNTKKLSLEKTYQEMQKDYYSVRDENGEFISLVSPDEMPSRAQFLYWHRKNRDVFEEARTREGDRNYNLKCRSSLEKTETFLSGPCAASQIDATLADIFLVRQDDRTAIVGRPIMYFLMDCYSRMVIGMHITLNPPSTESALRCILNAMEDKVTYCAKYGISIKPEDWPCKHAPSAIIADRGEVEGRRFDDMIKEFGISIENMPPYRGDLKGIIEQHFRLIHIDIEEVPGKMGCDYGERCTEDYRLDAVLDIREFTRIIIRCVLLYNNYHYMEYYTKTPHMRQMRVLPVPEKIWEYGLRYCNGAQKMIDVARFRYASYSKGIGSITNNGILFNGLYYGCEEGFRERWFDRARLEGRTKISVAYDTEDRRSIYIKVDSHSSPCECLLLDGNKITTPLTEAEVEQINRIDHEECERYRIIEDTETAQTWEIINKDIDGAIEKKPISEKSKAQRIREIKENRKAEIEAGQVQTGTSAAKDESRTGKKTDVTNKDGMGQILEILNEELEKAQNSGGNKDG